MFRLCDRICCFLEKFTQLWQKFYTAVGSDGSDKYHLFERGSLLSLNNKQQRGSLLYLNNKQQRGSLLSLTTCWTNFNQQQREQTQNNKQQRSSPLSLSSWSTKNPLVVNDREIVKKVCWMNARTVILVILKGFWHLFRKLYKSKMLSILPTCCNHRPKWGQTLSIRLFSHSTRSTDGKVTFVAQFEFEIATKRVLL